MINFTVGPVQAYNYICDLGREQVPYFRTSEFSKLMLENEQMLKQLLGASEDSRAVFLTGSGTAAMEATVMNLLDEKDYVLVVDGGSFGHRFVKLCELYNIRHDIITLQAGQTLDKEVLYEYAEGEYTALLINMHETSTGVLYDMDMVGKFCRDRNIRLIVDAISAFLAEPIDMIKMGIDTLIISSQKALACPPGVSALVMAQRTVTKVMDRTVQSIYLNIKDALINGERGQTPFTPAVSILIQIHERLRMIIDSGGAYTEINRVRHLAEYFREKIKVLPLSMFAETPSYAVSALKVCEGKDVSLIVETLKTDYGIWVCPNGGELGKSIFRVGHIGALEEEDFDKLIVALKDLEKKNIL